MVTNEEFRATMSRVASSVSVVTTRDSAGKPHGLTVSAFCSLSAEPPMVLACIHKKTGSHYAFFERQAFVVNVLADDQHEVSQQFASPADDKFNGIETEESIDGLPKITGCIATLECRIVETHDGGDHTILVGSIERTTIADGMPLMYFRGGYGKISE
jgi:flavin reductase (DIM6/NTAB) family NADH-FMN oxidoreductase RutF